LTLPRSISVTEMADVCAMVQSIPYFDVGDIMMDAAYEAGNCIPSGVLDSISDFDRG